VANNYLQFSEALELKSEPEFEWFKRYMEASHSSGAGWDDDAKPVSDEAKFWGEILGDEDYACFTYEFEKEGIWFYAEESGSPLQVAELVRRFFKEMRPDGKDTFALSWAETCSKMRTGEFGGGACLVTKDEVKCISTWEWVDQLSLEGAADEQSVANSVHEDC
jgi:hypothetical protein